MLTCFAEGSDLDGGGADVADGAVEADRAIGADRSVGAEGADGVVVF